MPTLNQLIKKNRKKKIFRSRVPALECCPQKKGICIKVFIRSPKKPNSAVRKLVKVRLSTRKKVNVYVPGEGGHQSLQEYSTVLVRGGRVKDLPGIKYKLVHGKFDFVGLRTRKTSRSLYGSKKTKN